jgi:hypothetical protein
MSEAATESLNDLCNCQQSFFSNGVCHTCKKPIRQHEAEQQASDIPLTGQLAAAIFNTIYKEWNTDYMGGCVMAAGNPRMKGLIRALDNAESAAKAVIAIVRQRDEDAFLLSQNVVDRVPGKNAIS